MASPVTPATPTGVPGDSGVPASGGAEKVYRPAYAIKLTIRLEDFTNDDGQFAQVESAPAKDPHARAVQNLQQMQALQAVRRASGDLDVNLDAQVEQATKKVAKMQQGKTSGVQAAAPLGAGADDYSIELRVVPTDLTLSLNGFNQADKLELEVPLANLPLPPDLVRSLFVEVFCDEVGVNDFANPVRWIPKLFQTPPVFRGYADEESMDTDEGRLAVHVTALSLEQRLMALKINPFTKARRIAKGGEPITSYVQRLVSTIPEFNGTYGNPIGVRMFPNVDPSQIPFLDAKLFKKSLQSAQSRAAAGGMVQGAPPPGTAPGQDPGNGTPAGVGFSSPAPQVADVSVWDIITRAAWLAGVIPVYDPSIVAVDTDGSTQPIGANNILLMPPQNLMETPQDGITIPGGPPDGFSRTITVGGTTQVFSQCRFFVWGSNITSMKTARKYGRVKAPRVRCIGHNPDAPAGKRTLTAVFPTTTRGTTVSAKGSGQVGKGHAPIEEEVVRLIKECRSQEQLQQIAVALYHTIGRHESVVTIETTDLASYYDPDSGKPNPDVLRLRPGTPCRVMVVVADPASNNQVVNGLSELMARRYNPAFLRRALLESADSPRFAGATSRQSSAGVDGNSASSKSKIDQALAKLETAFQSTKLTDWFYCRAVEHRWNSDDGWSASIELATFQEARNLPQNLSKQDRDLNDQLKAAKTTSVPDPAAAATADNLSAILNTKSGGL